VRGKKNPCKSGKRKKILSITKAHANLVKKLTVSCCMEVFSRFLRIANFYFLPSVLYIPNNYWSDFAIYILSGWWCQR